MTEVTVRARVFACSGFCVISTVSIGVTQKGEVRDGTDELDTRTELDTGDLSYLPKQGIGSDNTHSTSNTNRHISNLVGRSGF